MRLNGESTQDNNRQSGIKGSLVHSVPFSFTTPKPATLIKPNEELTVSETSHQQQNSPVSPVPDPKQETVKEEKESSLSIQEENSKEDISSTMSESEPEG